MIFNFEFDLLAHSNTKDWLCLFLINTYYLETKNSISFRLLYNNKRIVLRVLFALFKNFLNVSDICLFVCVFVCLSVIRVPQREREIVRTYGFRQKLRNHDDVHHFHCIMT